MRQSTAIRAAAAVLAVFVAACELGTEPAGSEVAEIRLEPTSASITVDGTVQLNATARDEDGEALDARVFWASEDSTLARVSGSGLVTGRAIGTVRVAASAGGRSALATISISAKPVETVTVTPPENRLLVGEAVTLTAVARDAGGGVLAGRAVSWNSADDGVATVDAGGAVTAVAAGSTEVTATIDGKVGTASIVVLTTDVARVAVTPSSAALRIGDTQQFSARAFDADDQELTGREVEWSSSEPDIVTISDGGLATAVAVGAAEITATIEGVSATVPVGVGLTPVSTVTVTPGSVELKVGERAELTAVVKAADGSVLSGRSVTWASSSPAIASVNRTTGEVTAVAPGKVTLTATSEGKTGTAEVTVVAQPVASVEVLPASFTLVVGGSAQLEALPKAANGSTLTGRAVTWKTDKAAVATVSSSGRVTAVAPGTAKITATSEGKSGSATVTVQTEPVASVEVDPKTANLFVGATRQLRATVKDGSGDELEGRFVSWSSDEAGVAVVDAAGRVAGVSPGRATITATSEGKSATAEITVLLRPVATVEIAPATATVLVGDSRTLEVTLKAENGDVLTGRTVAWSSGSPGVATVSGTGVVTAFAPGKATITARSEGKTGTAEITVERKPVSKVLVTPSTATLTVDDTRQLLLRLEAADGTVLTGRSVTWRSNAESVATVSSGGLVTARGPGSARITATSEGKSGSSTITVEAKKVATVAIEPASAALNVGDTQQFTATARAGDGSELSGHAVSWTSTAPGTVSVSSTGLATALAVGSATIRATIDGKVGSAPVGVGLQPVDTIVVTPSPLELVAGTTETLSATLRAANGSEITGRSITWTSDAVGVATVNAAGEVRGVEPGTATITASSGGKSTTVEVTVTPKPVATVTVTPRDSVLIIGQSAQLTVTLRAGDSSILTGRSVTWTSSNEAAATVSETGLVTARSAGAATITATSEGKTGTAEIEVIPVPVATVEVSPSSATLVVDSVHPFTVRVLAEDGTELSGREVSWSSSAASVVEIDEDGRATAKSVGTAIVQATVEGEVGSANVTVTPKPVASVEVEPASVTLEVDGSTTLVATTRAADGSVLTGRDVAWSSEDVSIATVDGDGDVTAVAPGTATITASSEGVEGTATVTVEPPPVATVTVTPAADTLLVGETVTLSAATLDEHGAELTGRAIAWSSDNTVVAVVDGDGLVTALASGVTRVSAESEEQTGSSQITVRPAPAELVIVSGDDQIGRDGASLTDPLVVLARDAAGDPVAGALVHWSTADGSITPAEARTAADGTTSAIWTLGSEGTAPSIARAETTGAPPVEFSATRGAL